MAENSKTQAKYAYPKFKVFIFGVDVTVDVTSIKTSSHDGKAPNTCQIQLQNPGDRYIFNTDDIAGGAGVNQVKIPWMRPRDADSTFVEQPYGSVISDIKTRRQQDPVKQRVILAKLRVTQNLPVDERRDPFGNTLGVNFANYYGENIKRYPCADGLPIFHPMDPVRVFMRDPFDPARWYHHFCGFVSDMVENLGSNGEQELMIQAEDPMKLLRYTRVFLNPGVLDAKTVIQSTDLRAQSFNAHYMKNFDLPEVLFTALFGPDRVGAETLQQRQVTTPDGRQSAITTKLRGIGHFSYEKSNIYTFGPPGEYTIENASRASADSARPTTKLYDLKEPVNLDSLAQWQYLIDHEVQPSDLHAMFNADNVDYASINAAARLGPDGLIDTEWVIDYIGSNPDLYLVDGGRLMVLLPNSLGVQNRSVVVKDILNSYPMNSEWQSVAEILYDLVDRMQFSMYCTPRGDIVIEPPLYDFSPDHFGMTAISPTNGQVAANTFSISEELFLSRPRGPFGPRYVVTRSDTVDIESAFTDDKIHTIAVVAKQIFPGWDSLPNTSIVGDLAVAKIPDLIPIYGARQAPITHRSFVSTEEGAHLYGNLVLNKLNADAHTMTVGLDSNIKMWVNRPIYIEKRNCIATTRRVDQSLQWGARGSMDTRIDLHATRTWTGDVDVNGTPIYNTIGGVGGAPLDYSVLFKVKPRATTKPDKNG